MNHFKKGSEPRFHEQDAAVYAEDAVHFGKSLIEIAGQRGEMMQAALDDEDILGAIGKRKLTAIAENTLCWSAILRQQPGRKIDALDVCEANKLESNQTVSAATEELDDFGIAGPLGGAQAFESDDEFSNFLLG